jgi:hypothetical protein
MPNYSDIADSYLEHIRIAINARDAAAPFRTFFDNWYAFKRGDPFLSKKGRPVWLNNPSALTHGQILPALEFISQKAGLSLALASEDRRDYGVRHKAKDETIRLIVDHAVPVTIIVKELLNLQQPSKTEIEEHLLRWYQRGVIATEEDRLLTKSGLKSVMPSGWDRINPFARYENVSIAKFTSISRT